MKKTIQVKKNWTAVLQTRDGFIKLLPIDMPRPYIEFSWWMPGLVNLKFGCVSINSNLRQAHYLLGETAIKV